MTQHIWYSMLTFINAHYAIQYYAIAK